MLIPFLSRCWDLNTIRGGSPVRRLLPCSIVFVTPSPLSVPEFFDAAFFAGKYSVLLFSRAGSVRFPLREARLLYRTHKGAIFQHNKYNIFYQFYNC